MEKDRTTKNAETTIRRISAARKIRKQKSRHDCKTSPITNCQDEQKAKVEKKTLKEMISRSLK